MSYINQHATSKLTLLGAGLSAHLEVPLPFLMYRAQVRYEEDLRGLQGNLGASVLATPGTPRPTLQTKLPDKRPSSVLRSPLLGLRTSQPPPLSRGSTPVGTPRNRLASLHKSPLGLQGSQMSPLLTSNSALLDRPGSTRGPLPGSPLTIRRPPSPPSPRSPSSSSSESDEGEREKEENRQQVDRQLKQLEKMMSSQLLGFARPKGEPSKARERMTLSMVKETRRSDDPTSSASSSVPSIPSPPPERRADAFLPSSTPRGVPRGGALGMNTRATRSPPHSPSGQVLRNKVIGKHAERASNQGSSASSFSDISGMLRYSSCIL